MTNSILLDIILPTTRKHYDFWVPGSMTMQGATMLIAEAMRNIEPDFYLATPDAALMLVSSGQIQDPNATLSEIGFVNGTSFMLV